MKPLCFNQRIIIIYTIKGFGTLKIGLGAMLSYLAYNIGNN